jgi:hypothetical protein
MFGWLRDACTLSGECEVRLYGSWSKQLAYQRLRKVGATYFQINQLISKSNLVSDAKIEVSSPDQIKGKAVPLQAWSGPEGSRKLRFSHFMTTAQDGGKVVSLTHQRPLPPGNTPGTHFC